MTLRLGMVGWRGMVGSVLLERMQLENDFTDLEITFFSTSNPGGASPKLQDMTGVAPHLVLASDLAALKAQDVVITCQGGAYTQEIYPKLRGLGWDGYWIDAASTLRMSDDAAIALDPVNRSVLLDALANETRTFCGGNCTVSLMLMGLSGLFAGGHIAWLSSMTYQSASGAGAQGMIELVSQMASVGQGTQQAMQAPHVSALAVDKALGDAQADAAFPVATWGAPLAGSLIPWIDVACADGQTKEEWKAGVEANKILATQKTIPMDGLCVRVGSMRCHAQAYTMRLHQSVPLDEIEAMIASANPWVEHVPNTREDCLRALTPAAVSGSLNIPVGRIRKLKLGDDRFLTAFSVGDQLLWGAAEPLRRMFRMIRTHCNR